MVRMGGGQLALCGKWRCLGRQVMKVQEKFSVMCTPRNLELLTLSKVVPLMCNGEWFNQVLLMSTIISLVLSSLRDRLWSSPFCELVCLLPEYSLFIVADEAYNCSVFSKIDIWTVQWYFAAQLSVRRVKWTVHAALGSTGVQCGGARGGIANPGRGVPVKKPSIPLQRGVVKQTYWSCIYQIYLNICK